MNEILNTLEEKQKDFNKKLNELFTKINELKAKSDHNKEIIKLIKGE